MTWSEIAAIGSLILACAIAAFYAVRFFIRLETTVQHMHKCQTATMRLVARIGARQKKSDVALTELKQSLEAHIALEDMRES